MAITYEDLANQAEEVKNETRPRHNAAARIGKLFLDIINYIKANCIKVVQTTGQSTTDVMSQNAVTEALSSIGGGGDPSALTNHIDNYKVHFVDLGQNPDIDNLDGLVGAFTYYEYQSLGKQRNDCYLFQLKKSGYNDYYQVRYRYDGITERFKINGDWGEWDKFGYDKSGSFFSVYNVSRELDIYDFKDYSKIIAATPVNVRRPGLIITGQLASGLWGLWQYIGNNSSDNNKWNSLINWENYTTHGDVENIIGDFGILCEGNVVQEKGNSKTDVMSQNAVTEALSFVVGRNNSSYIVNGVDGGFWLRVAKLNLMPCMGILSVTNEHYNKSPAGLNLFFATGYPGNTLPSLSQIGGRAAELWGFTKARIVFGIVDENPVDTYLELFSTLEAEKLNPCYFNLANDIGVTLMTEDTKSPFQNELPTGYEEYVINLAADGISAKKILADSILVQGYPVVANRGDLARKQVSIWNEESLRSSQIVLSDDGAIFLYANLNNGNSGSFRLYGNEGLFINNKKVAIVIDLDSTGEVLTGEKWNNKDVYAKVITFGIANAGGYGIDINNIDVAASLIRIDSANSFVKKANNPFALPIVATEQSVGYSGTVRWYNNGIAFTNTSGEWLDFTVRFKYTKD